MTFEERSDAGAKPTFDETVKGYMEQRDNFIKVHGQVYNTLYGLNLDLLGLTPDDERKDLLDGIKDYTYLTMCDGMDMFADMLLGMICDKYPVIGLKIKKNKERYMGSNASDNPGANESPKKAVKRQCRTKKAPTSSLK